ncbi:MAG: protein-glutamate O-methyltransferase CheR [Nitrospirae bacterium]|nr:protein-glutamate O-methyltransferase CheR [Nitrospirota bacterium]
MLTDEEFRLFRNLIHEEAGIYLKESRKDYLESRLLRRMQMIGSTSPYRYYMHVSNGGRQELMNLLDLLTINETSFFRNRPQIELFRNMILPQLVKAKAQHGRKTLRIWSAGCSTGEEPYTIAIVLAETIRDLQNWDVRIYASDLSLSVLDTASQAMYDADKVQATIEDSLITRYFDKVFIEDRRKKSRDGGNAAIPQTPAVFRYRVKDALRRLVIFDFHNLQHENSLAELDVIFCRNVMIYFDEQGQRRLIDRFCKILNPEGYLLLGHSESLHGWMSGFDFVFENRGTAYRKKGKEG